ncbi:hypothetical protein HYU45_05080, partial [Candidatus Daviesbacteria bacterium]|nr:hypothetical protein [Candidatus Daviesbacteria bacterium]MBI2196951.1 hypothetical protein [Candidatus Daviesbacteria bacterium]
DGQDHPIYAYGLNIPGSPGKSTLLSNSPKTINCPAPPNPNPNPPPNPNPNKANTPWIQTTGGDVHSNTRINTPGGP